MQYTTCKVRWKAKEKKGGKFRGVSKNETYIEKEIWWFQTQWVKNNKLQMVNYFFLLPNFLNIGTETGKSDHFFFFMEQTKTKN